MASGVGGQIQGISLDSFLQMAQMEKTTCTLKVISGSNIGYLYISKGSLFSAETGELTNRDAVYEIIGWDLLVATCASKCAQRAMHLQNLAGTGALVEHIDVLGNYGF